MNPTATSALRECSLLVKARPGATSPFALENLRTGRRLEFASLTDLLEALSRTLAFRDPTQPGDERCEP